MTQLLRYDEKLVVHSNLSPLEDVLFWIGGLRSKGLVRNILKEKHRVDDDNEIEKRATSISEHAEIAVNLLEQGFSGPIETSFLPLYYGLLNLSKIYILCSRQFSELEKNRWHGATFRPTDDKEINFLSDIVILKSKGTIPLLYRCITGQTLNNNNQIQLSEIYPFIVGISHEFSLLHKKAGPFKDIKLTLNKDDTNGHNITLTLLSGIVKNSDGIASSKILEDYVKVSDNTYKILTDESSFDEAKRNLLQNVNRFLIYEQVEWNRTCTFVPISDNSILLPEELPILLAFFHLSNIVRYNPELLFKLKDSPEWGMIQTLSRHGTYSFMMLFWSYVQQTSFAISKL